MAKLSTLRYTLAPPFVVVVVLSSMLGDGAAVVQQPRQHFGRTTESPGKQRAPTILASELDPDLPAAPIGEWLQSTVQPDREMQWMQTACPATHEEWVAVEKDRPICVMLTASQRARAGSARPQGARKGELVVAISIRLGRGNPNVAAWELEPPAVEDAFIERDDDSLTIEKLGDLPRLLALSPEQWPRSDLSVSTKDIRCDPRRPTPGETVKCQATVHNRGPAGAIAQITARIETTGVREGVQKPNQLHGEFSLAQTFRNQRVAPNGSVVVSWDWVWPHGSRWEILVSADQQTRHAFGGYRIPIKERSRDNNHAFLKGRAR